MMIQYRKNTSEGSKKCSQKVDIDKISKKTSIIIGYLKKYQLRFRHPTLYLNRRKNGEL